MARWKADGVRDANSSLNSSFNDAELVANQNKPMDAGIAPDRHGVDTPHL